MIKLIELNKNPKSKSDLSIQSFSINYLKTKCDQTQKNRNWLSNSCPINISGNKFHVDMEDEDRVYKGNNLFLINIGMFDKLDQKTYDPDNKFTNHR